MKPLIWQLVPAILKTFESTPEVVVSLCVCREGDWLSVELPFEKLNPRGKTPAVKWRKCSCLEEFLLYVGLSRPLYLPHRVLYSEVGVKSTPYCK